MRVWEREQPVRCCLVSKNGVLENIRLHQQPRYDCKY
jgi:hypothetical protein